MDYRQLSNLLIKVSGIVIVVFAVTAIPGHINSFLHQGQDTLAKFAMWVIFPLIAPVIIGLLMWSFPGTITNRVFDKSIESSESNRAAEEIERIAVTILGLILLFFALSDLAFNFTYVYFTNKENAGVITSFRISPEDWGHIVGTIVEIAFALTILLKSKGVILLIKRLRA
ncbi:hypothetical protein [Candidatus Endoriftia persephonae]|jgi:hypothetical protein|uniref:Uncharacterized protein n=1 Tax=Candidatus Endoriftia persephonae TaxID=393765 RepID=A0A9J6ZUQ5_9GAMM|nr:hypothetical protein [Candidatus Endoriftia persephone]USF86400.1 hypothetical protein L0Y14_09605 [Candidatus Endoriftia persephone]